MYIICKSLKKKKNPFLHKQLQINHISHKPGTKTNRYINRYVLEMK